MGDFERRGERGREVFARLAGSEAAGRGMVDYLEAQGALGSIALRTGAGELWNRPQFERRDRSLVVISMLTALGRERELRAHVEGGLHHGLERDEIDEILVQLAPYIGVPFSLGGAGVVAGLDADGTGLRQPPAPMEPREDADRREAGKDVLRTLVGLPEEAVDGAAEATLEQLGDMGAQVLDYAFGDVWSRPGLSRRDRSLAVISALAALNLAHELEIHLGGALRHGVTPAEIEEVMMTLVVYGGFPRAIEGLQLARKVLAAAEASNT